MLKFDNVSFKYSNNNSLTLKNIDFSIAEGEWLTILGNNGSGKSTITKLICGQYGNYEGKIFYNDCMYSEGNYKDILSNIAVVFQNPDNQFVGVTVEDDIAFGLENRNIPQLEMEKVISSVLKTVDMLEFRYKEPRELSGGQKQRVAIAAALAVKPKVLILDEATSMLDPLAREQILTYIKKINREKNITIISITHDIEELKYSDNILLINNGEIITKSRSCDIYSDKQILENYNIEIPFVEKIKDDLNIKLGNNLFNMDDDIEGVAEKICTLILKK